MVRPSFYCVFSLCVIIRGLGRAGAVRMIGFRRGFGVLFGHFWRVGGSAVDSGLVVSLRRGQCSVRVVLIRGTRQGG